MPVITTINVAAVLVFSFVAGVGWHLGARLVGWVCTKRS